MYTSRCTYRVEVEDYRPVRGRRQAVRSRLSGRIHVFSATLSAIQLQFSTSTLFTTRASVLAVNAQLSIIDARGFSDSVHAHIHGTADEWHKHQELFSRVGSFLSIPA